MSERIFIDLYLDEDVPVVIAQIVNARGYSVVTARDAGLLGLTDEEQLQYAFARKFVLLTHNREVFLRLHDEWLALGRHHAGILAAFRRPVPELVSLLLTLLNEVMADEMYGQLRFL